MVRVVGCLRYSGKLYYFSKKVNMNCFKSCHLVIFRDEAARMWTKREAEWERERLARERLMAEVSKKFSFVGLHTTVEKGK